MKTPRELEKLINESPLFLIDRVKDKEFFVAEERRFLADLAELMSFTRKNFREIGYEIAITAKACIKSYNAECGAFLNYFNTALKKSLFTQKAKEEISDTRTGLTLDQKTDKIIRRIVQYTNTYGGDPNKSGFVNEIADALNILPEKAAEAISINSHLFVQSGNDIIRNKEGKKGELFDFLTDKSCSSENALIDDASFLMHIQAIDSAFKKQQDRTKPLLSKLLTARLLKALDDIRLIEKAISGISFIDNQIYARYKKKRTVPTAKEIAESFGVMEASASRTYNIFIEKIVKIMFTL